MDRYDRKKSDQHEKIGSQSSKKRRYSSSDSSSESDGCRHRRHQHKYKEYKHHRRRSGYSSRRESEKQTVDSDLHRNSGFDSKVPLKNEEFSFQNYHYELNKLLLRDEELVSEPDDFWKFLKNYEAVQKRAAGKKHDMESFGKFRTVISPTYFICDLLQSQTLF